MLQSKPIKKLLFIYNAQTGFKNKFVDAAHKIVSPSSYPCSLCDITFGKFSEKLGWKQFRTAFKIPMLFIYKDEFDVQYASKFKSKYSFPIVLAETNDGFEVFIKTEELDALKNEAHLINLVSQRCAL